MGKLLSQVDRIELRMLTAEIEGKAKSVKSCQLRHLIVEAFRADWFVGKKPHQFSEEEATAIKRIKRMAKSLIKEKPSDTSESKDE